MFEADAGMGLENFDKTFMVNVFDEARKVKNYKQLEYFIERFIIFFLSVDGMSPCTSCGGM